MAVVLFYLCVDTNIANIDSALAIWIERTVSLSCWMIVHVLSEWDGRHKLSGELFPPFHHDYRSLTLSGTTECAALVYPECGFTHRLLMKKNIYMFLTALDVHVIAYNLLQSRMSVFFKIFKISCLFLVFWYINNVFMRLSFNLTLSETEELALY